MSDQPPPEVRAGYEEWLLAFWELSTDRQLGASGVGPIPAASVERWMPRYLGEAEAFRSAIRAMDQTFLSRVNGDKRDLPKEALPQLTAGALKSR